LTNAAQLIPDYGELEPLFLGAIWLGVIVGLSAAARADENATWAEDTPKTVDELLARGSN
jgi:hypothetical protein